MTLVNIDARETQRRMGEHEDKLRENAKVRAAVREETAPAPKTHAYKGPTREEIETMMTRRLAQQRNQQRPADAQTVVATRPSAPLDPTLVKSAVSMMTDMSSKTIRRDLQPQFAKNLRSNTELQKSYAEIVEATLPTGFGNMWLRTGVQYASVYYNTTTNSTTGGVATEATQNVTS